MKKMFDPSVYLALRYAGGEIIEKGGKEYTLFGISRRETPYWSGWQVVDGLKATRKFSVDVAEVECQREIKNYYRDKYWTPLDCNNLPLGVDLFTFDTAVVIGVENTKQLICDSFSNYSDILKSPPVVCLDKLLKHRILYLSLSKSEDYIVNQGMQYINRSFDAHSIAIGEL